MLSHGRCSLAPLVWASMSSIGRLGISRRKLQAKCAMSAAIGLRSEIRSFAIKRKDFGAAGRILAQGLDLDDWSLQFMFTQHPGLAGLSAEDVLATLVFLHEKGHIPKVHALATVVRAAPELLIADVQTQLAPTLATLQITLSRDTLLKVLCECPRVLLREPEEITDVWRTFGNIGLSFEDLVTRTPRISLCNASTVQQVYDSLQDPQCGPGMKQEEASVAILLHPAMIVGPWCPIPQMALVATFLRDVVGANPASIDCARFYAMPNALKDLEHSVNHLTKRGFTMEEVRENITLLCQPDS